MAVNSAIKEVLRRCDNKIPLIDPEKDMKINTPDFKETVKKIKTFENRLKKHSLNDSKDLHRLVQEYRVKAAVMSDLAAAKHNLKKSKSLLQMDQLKCMKRVLRRLGYCSASDVIEIKGRIACELSSADELLLTEMMFNNVFNPLNPPQVII
jgi:ATP-dependent RNA helicase DOB1